MAGAKVIDKGKYQHSKTGKLYDVIGLALDTETEMPMVIYRPLYDCDHEFFARPYDMFVEQVAINGKNRLRFEKVVD